MIDSIDEQTKKKLF